MTEKEKEEAFKLFIESCKEYIEFQKQYKELMNCWISQATTEEELGMGTTFLTEINEKSGDEKKIMDIISSITNLWEKRPHTPEFEEMLSDFVQLVKRLNTDKA